MRALAILGIMLGGVPVVAQAAWVWVEGEDAETAEVSRHPWWYDKVDKELLSGGDFLSHFTKEGPGRAEYLVKAPKPGKYDLWVRANPRKAGMSYSINDEKPRKLDFERDPVGLTNIAEDKKPDLRFIAWVHAGKVKLEKGENKVVFVFEGKDHHHGSLDAFLLTTENFEPRGILKPGEKADESGQEESAKNHGKTADQEKVNP